jgi:hypothetical protein
MQAAGAENGGGDGALNRFGRRAKGHPGRGRAGGHAVIDEHDEHGRDHARLLRGRQPAFEHQVDHWREADPAEPILVQIGAAHGDAIALGAPIDETSLAVSAIKPPVFLSLWLQVARFPLVPDSKNQQPEADN